MTARIEPTPITGPFGVVVRLVSRRMFGRVPESLGIMWHHVPLLRASMTYGQRIGKQHECDESLKTFAHMAVASLVGCSWCLDLNYFLAHHGGLDLAKAREVPQWRASTAFTALEREVLGYAEAMSVTPPSVTDAMVDSLREQLGAAGLLELTAVIGYANLTTRSNTALGIESEEFAASCGLAPIVPAATVRSQA